MEIWHTRLLFLLWHESYRLLIHYSPHTIPSAHAAHIRTYYRIVWILACFRLNCVFTKRNEFLLFQFHESEANPFLFSFLNWFWLNVTCKLIKNNLVSQFRICEIYEDQKRMFRTQNKSNLEVVLSNSICVVEECVFLESSFRDIIYGSLSLHT